MNNLLIAYFIYLPVVLLLTIYVSRTLFKNSRVFMMDIFNGRVEIAESTNRLFELGFYLLNVGFALYILEIHHSTNMSYQQMTEVLSQKIGGFTMYLGVTLFLNLFLFFRGKRKARQGRLSAQTS